MTLCSKSCTTSTEKSLDTASADKVNIPDEVDFIFHVKPILSDRCFACHGPDESKVEAGLQLHTEEKAYAALGENKDRFAIIPGDLEKSTLIHRVTSDDPDVMMPPPESNLDLSNDEIKILVNWIEQGAQWKEHWAYLPPREAEIPLDNNPWVSNPIDNFILAKLHENDLSPSPPLSNEKLIRKLSFDLTGLPPSIEILESYNQDHSVENYERIVDQYLTTDAHAEKMTNEWLDIARYADTHGYQDDLERIMWPWRDWVIHAFKNNMPYDKFITWQIAGDLLPGATREQIIATAFNRNHKITQEGGVIPEEYRSEYVTDRTNTFGTAFLGLTFECAKCHDHKYDPISQKEYFQLYGFFNNVDEKGLIEPYGAIPDPYIELNKKEIDEVLTFINNVQEAETIPLMVMKELKTPRKTHVLNRGVYDQIGEEVKASFPSLGLEMKNTEASLNRLDLAEWLFSNENPLTGRVTVNRLWQQFFGKGIVATSYDFGNQGSLPTHPELLDYLALKLQRANWDLRSIIKDIVTSSTYKQGSKIDPALLLKDPENDLIARSFRSRLSAEMLRDHALKISGLLVEEIGGPSVKPYQPAGLWNEVTGGGGGSTAKYVQDEGNNNYRRSLYTFWKRTVPPPNMLLFDTPTRDFCMVKRENTSTPLQALVLMNDPQFIEASISLAYRAIQEKKSENIEELIQFMFTLATSRKPDSEELSSLKKMYDIQLDTFEKASNDVVEFLKLASNKILDKEKTEQLAAMSFVASTIFNLDETIRKT